VTNPDRVACRRCRRNINGLAGWCDVRSFLFPTPHRGNGQRYHNQSTRIKHGLLNSVSGPVVNGQLAPGERPVRSQGRNSSRSSGWEGANSSLPRGDSANAQRDCTPASERPRNPSKRARRAPRPREVFRAGEESLASADNAPSSTNTIVPRSLDLRVKHAQPSAVSPERRIPSIRWRSARQELNALVAETAKRLESHQPRREILESWVKRYAI